jgi:thiamine biosynthesis lipoprotein
MTRVVFAGMGTRVVVVAAAGRDPSGTVRLFRDVELRCSRFIEDSELSAINRDDRPVLEVSSEMARVLQVAADLRERTDGLVDVGVGGVVREWGYNRTFAEVRDSDEAPAMVSLGRWTIDGRRLHKASGVEIDLGGIAKGWACDLAVERGLASLVSAGGDVRSANRDGIVEVCDPWDRLVASIPLESGALATSSVTRRRWKAGGIDAHHIIDPRTLAPAVSPVLSATVTAPTAAEAEAGAKAVLLMGETGLAWADAQDWLTGALVVWHNGSVFATTGLELAA